MYVDGPSVVELDVKGLRDETAKCEKNGGQGVIVPENTGTDVSVAENGIAERHELEVGRVDFKSGRLVPRVPEEERQSNFPSEYTAIIAHDVE